MTTPWVRFGVIAVQLLGLAVAAFSMFSAGLTSDRDDAPSRPVVTAFLSVSWVFVICAATSVLVAHERPVLGLAVAFGPIAAFAPVVLWVSLL